MKRIFLLFCGLLAFAFLSQSFTLHPRKSNLKIEVDNLRSRSGKLMFELRNAKDEVVKRWIADIQGKKTVVELSGLAPGTYALRLFHDENNNDKLDTNMLGMPTEGYAFSNNVYGSFGPPALERQLFTVEGNKSIRIKMGY